MKKPDEIKKGLECCGTGDFGNHNNCPYNITEPKCMNRLLTDALALIQHLESKLNQAVEDIRLLGRMEFACPVCAYYNHGEGTKGECVKCLTGDGFRWRGEKDDGRVNDDHHRTE
jgi:hypothetical protein